MGNVKSLGKGHTCTESCSLVYSPSDPSIAISRMDKTMQVWGANGLHDDDRPAAWSSFLHERRVEIEKESKATYRDLVDSSEKLDTKIKIEINKDVCRTQILTSSEQESQLNRILLAYATRNENVGYCQGMNLIGSMLLKHLDEESAFWGLAIILEKLLPGYHNQDMIKLQTEQRVLESIVSICMPRLCTHLRELEVEFSHFSTKWLVGLFIDSLPISTVHRIWDCILSLTHEGTFSCRVLFGVSFSILSKLEETILAANDLGTITQIIGNFDQQISSKSDEQAFFHLCLLSADHIAAKTISQLRTENEISVNAETEAIKRLNGSLGNRWVVSVEENTKTKRSRLPRLRKRSFFWDEFEITFDSGPIGLNLTTNILRHQVVVKEFLFLPFGKASAASKCEILRPGDIVIAINNRSCAKNTFKEIIQRLNECVNRPKTIRFRRSKLTRKHSKKHHESAVNTQLILENLKLDPGKENSESLSIEYSGNHCYPMIHNNSSEARQQKNNQITGKSSIKRGNREKFVEKMNFVE